MIADSFHYCLEAAVPHAKALTGHTIDIGCAGCSTIKGDIANDNIFFRFISAANWSGKKDWSPGWKTANGLTGPKGY
jgi:hypothetical protein